MNSQFVTDPVFLESEQLYNLGLYLRIQPMLEALLQHPSTYGKLIGIRTLGHLGAHRRAENLTLRSWRLNRKDPWLALAYLRMRCHRRGPHRAWRQLNVFPQNSETDPECLADFHSLRAYIFGHLRDFREARAAYDEARRLDPKAPWLFAEWAAVCEMADRYEEALDVAEESLVLLPGYRPGIQAKARLLTLVGRDDEALSLLREAVQTMESGAVAAQLLELEKEKGLYADAWTTLERCAELQPLSEKTITTWLAAERTDLALRLDRPEEAIHHANKVDTDFYRRIAKRLEEGSTPGRRVMLPVGFVRQHYQTCAPATLAALSRYWSLAADHLEIAERICYDGTPNHSERSWAEEQGFVVREFTADWITACALIDAGIPFTLTTTWPGGAHLQAVIGYDALRGTLLIRDPFNRTHGEFEAASLFAAMQATGPRGLILLPQNEIHHLAGIELPDAPLWDGYQNVMTALQRHDRETAAVGIQTVVAQNPEHRLALAARRALALYDGDEASALSVTEELLVRFPDDVNLQLSKAASLSVLGTRAQQLEWLTGLSERAAAEPLVLVRYAQLLGQDGREAPQAMRLLQRALDRMPTDASAWSTCADLLWDCARKDEAITCRRIAACLSETNENHAIAYFRAVHFLGHTASGLEFLRERVVRLGSKSSAPRMTLFNQLEMLERTEEAFTFLDQALVERPDDADLLLFAAEAKFRYARIDEATALLAQADGRAKQAPWLRLSALLAREKDDIEAALTLAREALALEPLNLQHHRLIAQMLARHKGRRQAIAFLQEATARFDHHFELHQLLVEWLSDEDWGAVEPVLRHLVAINPSSAWAQRELAIKLARQNRHDEALALMAMVRDMAAADSYTHSTLGFIKLSQGHTAAGRSHLRDALTLSVDNDYALNTLVDTGTTLAERQESLDFVRRELIRQVTQGDGLLSFQNAAQRTLPPDEALTVLREAFDARPDLWQSWVAVGVQLIEMGRTEEALELIGRAIDRFPLLPRLRLEQGRARALQGQRDAARESYKLALQISPQWTQAVRQYVDTVLDEGVEFGRALAVIDAALARNPEDADLRGVKAWVLWQSGERQMALTELPQALMLDPRPEWMWNTLTLFGDETGDPELPHRVAEELAERRPGDIWTWIRAAEHTADVAQAIVMTDRALALEPRSQAAHETRLATLLRAGRFDEIDSALEKHPWEGQAPISIRLFGVHANKMRGNIKAAFQQLRQLIDEDANNYGLWELLAEWSDEDDRFKTYLEAAENLVRLAPNYYKAHGFLAHALMKHDERASALPHFERAFQLNPAYSFAGFNLADYYLDDYDEAKAAPVLEILAHHASGIALAVRQVRLAVLEGDPEAATAPLKEILRGTEDDWPVRTAIEAYCNMGWEKQLESEVERCFTTGACATLALHFWIHRQHRNLLPGAFHQNIQRGLDHDPQHVLMYGLLDYAGAKADASLLDWLLRHHRSLLTADTHGWALVSYALLATEQSLRTVTWMKDWRTRTDAPVWALDNLAIALRTVGDHETAREVSLRALELSPNNLDARTWLAVDAAREDRPEELNALLTEIDPARVRPYFQNLLTLLSAYQQAIATGDSKTALTGFRTLKAARRESVVLRKLSRALGRRLIRRYTSSALRPLRWLQFVLS